MTDHGVIMCVDSQDNPAVNITIGLPQGSPVSLVLFCIYISGVHSWVEDRVPGTRGISFMDDVTWFVKGSSVDEITTKLKECARESIRWGCQNAVQFKAAKAEVIILSKKRGLARATQSTTVWVDDRRIQYAKGATRWLGIWLDSALSLRESRRRILGRARRADAAIQKMVGRFGVPPASAQNPQQALIHGTLLYGAELSWIGIKKEEREV